LESGFDAKRKGSLRRLLHNEPVGRGLVRAGIERKAVERQADEAEFVAVQVQTRARPPLRIWPQRERRNDARGVPIESDVEPDLVDQVVRRAIVRQTDRLAGSGAQDV